MRLDLFKYFNMRNDTIKSSLLLYASALMFKLHLLCSLGITSLLPDWHKKAKILGENQAVTLLNVSELLPEVWLEVFVVYTDEH